MLLAGFPGPQLRRLPPLTAAPAASTHLTGRPQPRTPSTPAPCSCPLRGLLAQEMLFTPTRRIPALLPGAADPSPGFSACRPPRSSSWRLPGLRLHQGSRSLEVSILRPFPLPSHSKSTWPRPRGRREAGPGRKEAGAVSAGLSRRRPRPHALYLRGLVLRLPGALAPLPSSAPQVPVRTRTWLDPPSRGDYKPRVHIHARSDAYVFLSALQDA